MARHNLLSLFLTARWGCRHCRPIKQTTRPLLSFQHKQFSSATPTAQSPEIRAAPEINLEDGNNSPARIIPASPSYFTASPVFNDNVLLLQRLVDRHQSIPTVTPDQAPRMMWMKLAQYRSTTGEKITASKYARVLRLLSRLNKIHPKLRPLEVNRVLKKFQRPGAAAVEKAKPGQIDEYGRSVGVGRRKESSARVYLVEGAGEVLVNGKSIVQAFPRVHDRESALWPLKVSERTDKYNVFALVQGGGLTGQAESITLALARALLVQEPALKPTLRRGKFVRIPFYSSTELTLIIAGCVTSDARRVERKKPGRLKARKKPAWVKR